MSLSGCFLKSRNKLAVSGTSVIEGTVGLYEIDLATGVNRRLGGKLLATGFSLFPALAPDGKTLAVLHKPAGKETAMMQACLVDVAHGKARKLGKPLRCAHLSWAADGKSLLLTLRKPGDPLNPSAQVIVRMDLDGKLSEVRKGSRPLELPGDKGILFLDADKSWKTCDRAGKNAAQFGDGFKEHSTPTLSPDGMHLMMMRPVAGKGLQPIIIDLATGKTRAPKIPPGNWLFPSWR